MIAGSIIVDSMITCDVIINKNKTIPTKTVPEKSTLTFFGNKKGNL